MRRTGLFWKLLASFAVLIVAAIAVLASVFSGAYRSLLEGQLDDRLAAAAVTAGQLLVDRWPTAPSDDLQALVERVGKEAGVRLTLINLDGRVLGDSYEADVAAVEKMENHRDRKEFIDVRRTGAGAATRLSPTIGKRLRYQAVRVDNPAGERLGVVRAAFPTSAVETQVAGLAWWTWLVSAAVAAAVIALAWWALAALTEPMRSLAAAADAMIAGQTDFRMPAPVEVNDEVGAVARRWAKRVSDSPTDSASCRAPARRRRPCWRAWPRA